MNKSPPTVKLDFLVTGKSLGTSVRSINRSTCFDGKVPFPALRKNRQKGYVFSCQAVMVGGFDFKSDQ